MSTGRQKRDSGRRKDALHGGADQRLAWRTGQHKDGIRGGATPSLPWATAQRKDAIRGSALSRPPWRASSHKDAIHGGANPDHPWSNALITGASSGIGAALAKQLAAEGVFVILAARRLPLLKQLAMEIQSSGGRAVAVRLDVGRPDAAAKAIQALDTKYGIDLVIANAGVGIKKKPTWSWPAVRDATLTNYSGALATVTALLPQMVARGHGHVVAISSLASYTALPDAAGYSSPKAGLSRFMECLALDLQQTGVSVSTVHVGFVKTEMVARSDFPLPFLISAEAAATHIIAKLKKQKREINFPLPMVVLVRLLAALPFWLKQLIARRFG